MGQDRDILWRNGHFIDYRRDINLWRSRDPLRRSQMSFGAEVPFEMQMRQFEALPLTAIPLSTIRSPQYGYALVLDTASNLIMILDTQGQGNKDPFFNQFDRDKVPEFFRIPKTKFYNQEVSARLAPDLFQDFITQTAKLDPGFLPGSVRTDE